LFNKSFIEGNACLFDNTNMAEKVADTPIYRALVAVKPEELSFNAWAVRAGVSRSLFNEIQRHGNPRNDTLDKLLDAIDVSRVQFDAILAPVRTEVEGTGLVGTKEVSRAFYGERKPDLPVLGSAMGSDHGDLDEHIETTELHLGEVIEYLARPSALANDRDSYALRIVGDSMAPRFKPGELVTVSPRAPIGIGDDVIVQLRGQEGDDERVKLVLIKELARRGASARVATSAALPPVLLLGSREPMNSRPSNMSRPMPTCRPHPPFLTGTGGAGAGADGRGAGGDPPTAVPHTAQKAAPSGIAAPQLVQCMPLSSPFHHSYQRWRRPSL
jgi:phage repressor protein C with HTH and peptisase S24 domain